MKAGMLIAGLSLLCPAHLVAQTAPRLPPAPASPPATSVQAPLDPGYAALIAACTTPPPSVGGQVIDDRSDAVKRLTVVAVHEQPALRCELLDLHAQTALDDEQVSL